MTIMLKAYITASRIERLRDLLFLRKKLTVMGIIGHTHGVIKATRPPRKPNINMAQ